MKTGSISDKFWLMACLGSAAVIGFQLSADVNLMQHARAAHPDDNIVVSETDLSVFSAGADIDAPATELMVAAIAAQPLFAPGRQPMVQEVQAARSATPKPADTVLPDIELAGTLMADHTEVALIVGRERNSQHVRIGDMMSTWQVMTIDRDYIQLARDGEINPMPLRKDRPRQRQAAPAGRTNDRARN